MFPICLVVPGPTCDNLGKRRGGAARGGWAPRNQSLRDPTPCARGSLCLPRPAFSPILSGCGGLPPLKASDPGLLVKIIQGNPQTLMFCLLMLDCPKLWLVALCHPVVFNVAVLVRTLLRNACCMLLFRCRTSAEELNLLVDLLRVKEK